MEHKIKVDEKDHALDGQNKMNSFRKEKKHCDFIIKVESEEISVHRNVICSRSDYFDAMFSHDTKEKRTGVAEIQGVDRECTVKCVDFMYTGETSIKEEKCGDLMHVATMFQLLTLCNAIAAFLEEKLDCKSFFATKQLAELYSCQKLVDACNDFALKHFREISKMPEFKSLGKEYVGFLVGSKDTKVEEAFKCKSIIGWIKHSTSNRKSLLLGLMQKIDLTKIPLSYRSYLLEYEPLIYSSAEAAREFGLSCMRSMNVTSKDSEEADERPIKDEESAKQDKIRKEKVAQYAAKKAKKPGPIAKSNIILDVKPWDDETDMRRMEQRVRSIVADGLLWGSAKLIPVCFGIMKLQIACVVEDDKIGTDFLEEEITKFEDLVQSVDIAAFNEI